MTPNWKTVYIQAVGALQAYGIKDDPMRLLELAQIVAYEVRCALAEQGFKITHREPTRAMIAETMRKDGTWMLSSNETLAIGRREIWRVMHDAAPEVLEGPEMSDKVIHAMSRHIARLRGTTAGRFLNPPAVGWSLSVRTAHPRPRKRPRGCGLPRVRRMRGQLYQLREGR